MIDVFKQVSLHEKGLMAVCICGLEALDLHSFLFFVSAERGKL